MFVPTAIDTTIDDRACGFVSAKIYQNFVRVTESHNAKTPSNQVNIESFSFAKAVAIVALPPALANANVTRAVDARSFNILLL
jgi:hypothetical protein